MNETVLALVDAINSGDAIDTENAFAAAMAEKLSVRIDEYRQSVAASMFAQPEEVVEEETISEEEYNALSEEEKAEYELVSEEQLDELSTATLGSYVKKATVSNRNASSSFAHNYRDGNDSAASKAAKTMSNREKGISSAVNRLTS